MNGANYCHLKHSLFSPYSDIILDLYDCPWILFDFRCRKKIRNPAIPFAEVSQCYFISSKLGCCVRMRSQNRTQCVEYFSVKFRNHHIPISVTNTQAYAFTNIDTRLFRNQQIHFCRILVSKKTLITALVTLLEWWNFILKVLVTKIGVYSSLTPFQKNTTQVTS